MYWKINEISSISQYENLQLTSTFYYYYEDHFNCDSKLKKYADRLGISKAKEIMKKENGCNHISEKVKYTIDNFNYSTCVCSFRNDSLSFYMNILDKFDKGIMPFDGALMDQPNKMIEIIDRLSYLKNDFINRQNKSD